MSRRINCRGVAPILAILVVAALIGAADLGFSQAQVPRQTRRHDDAPEHHAQSRPSREKLTYDGKSFLEWCNAFSTELNPRVRERALPALVKFARHGYATEATVALFDALADDEPQFVNSVTDALSEIGEPAVPFLKKALLSGDADLRDRAVEALTRMRGLSLEAILDALPESSGETATAIADVVAASSSSARVPIEALPNLIAAFNASHGEGRAALSAALAKTRSPKAFATIFSALVEEGERRRLMPVSQLGQLYPQNSPEPLPGNDPAQAEYTTLITLAPENFDLLIRKLREGSGNEKRMACAVIGGVGPNAGPTAGALIPLLADADLAIRASALVALGNIGGGARAELGALLKLANTDDADLRGRVAWLLWNVAPEDDRAFSVVERNVSNDFFAARAVVESFRRQIRHWEQCGYEVKESPFQFGLSNEVEANPAKAVRLITVALGMRPPESDEELGPSLTETAICAIELLGGRAEATVPALVKLLASDEPWLRARAADALGAIGAPATTALPALNKLKSDPVPVPDPPGGRISVYTTDESTDPNTDGSPRTTTVGERAAAAIRRISVIQTTEPRGR